MNLEHLHDVLLRTHRELLESPLDDVEGLEGASCSPHLKHLAQIAMGDAQEGMSAGQWRATITSGLGPETAPLVDQAETCMRAAGLWPWP